jgi:hypothetical protein
MRASLSFSETSNFRQASSIKVKKDQKIIELLIYYIYLIALPNCSPSGRLLTLLFS